MPLIQGPKLGLSGKYRFVVRHPDTGEVITGRDGVPIYRDASGFVRRAGIWHPNLITDRGLDQYSLETIVTVTDLRYTLKVGSGSAAPNVADTELAAFVGLSRANGPGNSVYTYLYDTSGTPKYVVSSVRAAQYTAAGTVTLTEFGFDNSDANELVSIRELLRDELGDPTSVALTAGQILGVEHEGFLHIPEATAVSFDVVEKNLAGTTVGTVTYTGTLYAVLERISSSYGSYIEPSIFGVSHNRFEASHTLWTKAAGIGTGKQVSLSSAIVGSNVSPQAYVAGNFYRDYTLLLPAATVATGDAPLKSFAFGYEYASDLDVGYALILDDPQAMPKDTLHSLTLVFRLAWGRA